MVLARAIITDVTTGATTAKLMNVMMVVGSIMPVIAPVLGGGIAVSLHGSHQLAALAETWFGAATRQQPLLYVGGELGLGACVLTAATGVAAAQQSPGDLAHLRVRRGGPRCAGC